MRFRNLKQVYGSYCLLIRLYYGGVSILGCGSVIEYSQNLIWPRSIFLYSVSDADFHMVCL